MPPASSEGVVFPACETAPAMTAPALTKMQVTQLPNNVQAGQVVGLPGESRIYIVGHKNGQVYTFDNGMLSPMEGAKVTVAGGGNNEQGLLSIAFHPKDRKTFYLFYTAGGGGRIHHRRVHANFADGSHQEGRAAQPWRLEQLPQRRVDLLQPEGRHAVPVQQPRRRREPGLRLGGDGQQRSHPEDRRRHENGEHVPVQHPQSLPDERRSAHR